MKLNSSYDSDVQYLGRNKACQLVVLFLLFTTAFMIRIYRITGIPLDYHPVKQYRSALTARAFYYSQQGDIDAWKKQVAKSSLESIGYLGPPVVDYITASFYLLLGSEELWIPRALSVIYWLVGGLFLFLIARRMLNGDGAIVSTAIYLLLPFGVKSSQSYQPDPFMIMFMIVSLYTIHNYYEHPTRKNLLVAGFISAIAILIKPVSLFIIFGAFVGLQFHKRGFSKSLFFDTSLALFCFISLLPTIFYYGFGIINTENLDIQAQKSFIPQLLFRFDFWDGWLKRVKIALGHDIFIGSLLSFFLIPHDRNQKMVFGMWVGYFFMCLAFTYTISTHDYYHLPLFPIAALSLGYLARIILSILREKANQWYLDLGILIILLLSLFLNAGSTIQDFRKLPNYEPSVKIAEEIGEFVSHSTKTIFLAEYDGKPLMYYGLISGYYWPYWYDIRDEKLWGVKNMAPAERLQILSKDIDPEFFIVTDLEELKRQIDLNQYLHENFPILINTPEFIIFQLNE